MTNAFQKAWNSFKKNYHIYIITCYLMVITLVATYLKSPAANSFTIFAVGLGFLIVSISTYWLTKKSIFLSPTVPEKGKKIFFFYDYAVFFLFIICFLSIANTVIEKQEYFKVAFSYSMRLVTTSFHPLIPLESRLFHTLAPFSILAPWGSKKFKLLNYILLVFLVFLMQVKIGGIYLFCISVVFLWQNRASFSRRSQMTLGISLVMFCAFMTYFPSKQSWVDYSKLQTAKLINNEQVIVHESYGTLNNCREQADHRLSEIHSLIKSTPLNYYSIYRIFLQPSILSRLYVCAWENGFRGYYQGHQFARIFNSYKPVYNILYSLYYQEGSGNSHAHAVGNFLFDSYLQTGAAGVFFSGVIVSILCILISWFHELASPLGHLLRINLIYGTLTSSLLSTLIFFTPAIVVFFCLLWIQASRSASKSKTALQDNR